MKYKIVPINETAMTLEADSAEDAIVAFATRMDLDMNIYFKAIPLDPGRRCGNCIIGYETATTEEDVMMSEGR